jgi:3-deoxy-D-manno-octulosonic-acid transferase
VPVVMGPSFENFRDVVEGMRAGDAIRIVAPEMLAESLIAMLRDSDGARVLGARGRAVFEAQAGATERTVDALLSLLQERPVAGR